MTINKCSKCSHTWEARTDQPLACPKCKRYDWKTKGEPSPGKDQGEASPGMEELGGRK